LENSPIRTQMASENGRITLPPADIWAAGSAFFIMCNIYKNVAVQEEKVAGVSRPAASLGSPACTGRQPVSCPPALSRSQEADEVDGGANGVGWINRSFDPILAAVAAIT
jgi:hypothetical protein